MDHTSEFMIGYMTSCKRFKKMIALTFIMKSLYILMRLCRVNYFHKKEKKIFTFD